MSTFDTDSGRHLLTPNDAKAPLRDARLRELGLTDRADPEFDAFCAELAQTAARIVGRPNAPYAMINFITQDHQFFAGLYTPPSHDQPTPGTSAEGGPEVGRIMTLDQGYCPHVVDRGKALVLPDVCAYPRFAGNEVVDHIGIRTYLGAPLIDTQTGTALGTICVVDTEPCPWGREGLAFIKDRAEQVIQLIQRRAG
ncbi:GAF domain-containing protein [Streptomyces sp. B1866]|uniref:GAF domain-containing protein n=1 Tax=Streptomyces sp. B1866 TaxID=3075431 RepID=UPI002891C5D4|nr:GAF domain-containing protein [Streptomyces sp. B1866]MDT3397711.1 GAF domain-containing protein [Streptomyces sp. B1866]